ncbi:MAG TPA: pyridoxamine 5'-phosphate oxidase family protein [Kribbellaceae bacterium]|nr:pyridoxamine 5'-phosphate oxidase family protein [Kribbellaceae bacterium]
MAGSEPTEARNLDGYGAPEIPWSKVRDVLDAGISQGPGSGGPSRHTFWLSTVRPDGRPHVMPLGVLRVDDDFYFTAGPGTRKAKNLEQDPRCSLSVAAEPFDLVFEGEAVRVTDVPTVQRISEQFAGLGWETQVGADGPGLTGEFSAPSAGPPPWHVYRMTPATVFALGTAEPYGATRWQL